MQTKVKSELLLLRCQDLSDSQRPKNSVKNAISEIQHAMEKRVLFHVTIFHMVIIEEIIFFIDIKTDYDKDFLKPRKKHSLNI